MRLKINTGPIQLPPDHLIREIEPQGKSLSCLESEGHAPEERIFQFHDQIETHYK